MRFPGRKSNEILTEFNKYTSVNKKPFVIDLEKCHDSFLVTVDNQEILDFENHYASKLIAYNHPKLYEIEYLKKLSFAANNKNANPDHVTSELVAYYKLLHELAPKCMTGGNVDIMCFNSGAEAVENAMKYCVALWYQKNKNNELANKIKPNFISFDKSFHGRSVYTLSVTDMPHAPFVTEPYYGLVHENIRLPFPACDFQNGDYSVGNFGIPNKNIIDNCLTKLKLALEKNHKTIAGIIVEPIQGAGGHFVTKNDFFISLSCLAHKYDIPIIFDEVQTAGGCTGTFFMCDSFCLPYAPTVVCSAKKMATGVVYFLNPLETSGILDSTWSGPLVDMVRFVQEMSIVKDEKLIEQVPAKENYLKQKLEKLSDDSGRIFNIRGPGLYQGFSMISKEIRDKTTIMALQNESLLLMWAGIDSIRLRPHLHVTYDDIDSFFERMNRVLKSV